MNSDTLISTIINSLIALFALITILQTNSIQRKDSKPVLAMSLFIEKGANVFRIENVGKSGVKECEIKILNGKNISFQNSYFNSKITLFPTEHMEDILNYRTLKSGCPNYILIEVNYIEILTGKKIKYVRQVNFSGDKTESDELGLELRNIIDQLSQISRSENRMANYFEGRFLIPADTCNPAPNGSLYEDLNSVYNKKKGLRPKDVEKRKKQIKKGKEDKRNYFRDEEGKLHIPSEFVTE